MKLSPGDDKSSDESAKRIGSKKRIILKYYIRNYKEVLGSLTLCSDASFASNFIATEPVDLDLTAPVFSYQQIGRGTLDTGNVTGHKNANTALCGNDIRKWTCKSISILNKVC